LVAERQCECGCGRQIVQPRAGGPRKRFASDACRARFRRQGTKGDGRPVQRTPEAAISSEQRLRDLEELYRRLLRDIETEGTLIPSGQGGALKGNPSAALLVRVAAELGRIALPQEREEVGDGDDIGAALRAVS
jgi:hypothetical protein